MVEVLDSIYEATEDEVVGTDSEETVRSRVLRSGEASGARTRELDDEATGASRLLTRGLVDAEGRAWLC